jgi:hypothetical protein
LSFLRQLHEEIGVPDVRGANVCLPARRMSQTSRSARNSASPSCGPGVKVSPVIVNNTVAEVGIALESGRFSLHSNRRTIVVGVVIEVVATAAGLLLVVVLWHQPEAVWIPLIMVAALIGVVRIVTRASRRAAKLELLSEFRAHWTRWTS